MISDQLTVLHIKRACGERSYQRGLGYWRGGNVLEIQQEDEADNGIEIITAKTVGSQGRVYHQHIELREDPQGGVEIDGECTCPVGYDCKHVAAVLRELLDQRKQHKKPVHDQDRIESWLQELKQASRKSLESVHEEYPAHIQYRLVYVLEPNVRDGEGINVSTYKVRQLKKGGYGKPAAFSLSRATDTYYANDFLQSSDQEIARLLANENQFYYASYNSSHALKGELGELALQKMLLTGRCFWQSVSDTPLQFGGGREISFYWSSSEEGHQLMHALTPEADHIVRVGVFWYIDTERALAGPVQHEVITAPQLEALLDAPVIPDEHVEAVSRRLLLETPEYELETPVELDIERITISATEPQPVLRLETLEFNDQSHFHAARIGFGYGPATLRKPDERQIVQLIENDTIYRIERDVEAELDNITVLAEMGLRPLLDEQGQVTYDWGFAARDAGEAAMMWHEFLEHDLPELEAQGWRIERDEAFRLSFAETDAWDAELESSGTQWFTLTLGVDVDGERVNLLPLLVDILARASSTEHLREMLETQPNFLLPLDDHRWLKVPSQRLRPIFETLVELYDRDPLDKNGNLQLSQHQGVQIGDLLNDPQLRWRGADELRELNRKLRDFTGITPVEPPSGFNAELRHYQQQGLSWLQFLREFGFSGILADDMGLGKTVQTLAHILLEKQSGRMQGPSLVVAPTSLMGNWRREAENFAPALKTLVLHGPERHKEFHNIADVDLVFTTYPLLRRDKQALLEHEFHLIVLDEAQSIKNPKSQTTQVVFELKGKHRLCLSGTPMENHLGEIWSMFHFLMPGYLGTLERFNRIYRKPIEQGNDGLRREQLRRRIAPFMLRRTKADVAAELPEKTEIIRSVTLEGQQRDLYESIRMAMDKKVREEINRKGFARSQIMILDALLKLRQVCCDPRLLKLPQARSVQKSAKLELLMDMLPEMIEEGRRILLFSQFTSMLSIVQKALDAAGIGYSKLTGQTRKRDEAISRFQDGDVPVFLISLKAGGVGLNLTTADTVIHYDPWWNPAVENQATDRAHRIGQKNAVFVYKLITEDSVEDKILALQQKKQALADAIYTRQKTDNDSVAGISADDLNELLKPLDAEDDTAR